MIGLVTKKNSIPMKPAVGVFDSDRPIVLDGGLSSWLGDKGYDLDSDLWSARLILESPEAIVQAHMDFLEAGARIITTVSYQASLPGLCSYGLDSDQARRTILDSVSLAVDARDRFLAENPGEEVFIAASVGPYGAYLADGSEYRGNYGVSEEILVEFHRERLELLDTSEADFLACETIPDYLEARVLNELLMGLTKPAWVCLSCADATTIWDGTAVTATAELYNQNPVVRGIGINCTSPRYIGALIEKLKLACPDKSIVVYPNSGEVYDASTHTWSEGDCTGDFSPAVREWRSRGADIIGGCCRVSPEQVNRIMQELNTS